MSIASVEQVAAAVSEVLRDLDRGRTSRPKVGGSRQDVFAERLLSLRQAEGFAANRHEVRIAPGTVVTPLARDFLKRQGISLKVVSRSEVERVRDPGEWGLAIESDSGLISAFRRSLLDDVRPWHEVEGAAEAAAQWINAAPSRGLVLLTDQASVAVWLACQVPGVRAAQAGDVDSVDRAIRWLGLNLLVVEPAGKSISLLKQMSLAFQRAGAPRTVDGLEGRV
ncbi:hypothetical protein [Singulisphaera acidiphila]|uniref:Uncharacterized protein n=1 Tax=Singulisphaera acidiphila (strain ATCC BAA-1392 / DSM 18658 / VKM B-2454 / MOB10) TaxID=886293 RepID=L0DBC3_SINAD|nr:hypothetical protein [Singulisphaera acidiphila]AGA26138.1 hypothetical protein Sinac_1767 [Singulisphaera acidiphila DSM 18658]